MKRVVTLAVVASGAVLWAIVAAMQSPALCQQRGPQTVPIEASRFSRLVALHELARIHHHALETTAEFQPVVDQLYDQLRIAMQVDATWKARVVLSPDLRTKKEDPPPGDAKPRPRTRDDRPLTDFETRALRKLAKGDGEVLEYAPSGDILYMQPVRMRESCVMVCHRPLPGLQRDLAETLPDVGVTVADGAAISLIITLREGEKKGEPSPAAPGQGTGSQPQRSVVP